MIALIDYGAGNLRSVEKALRYVGADVEVVSRPEQIEPADGVVLPGVGAFDDCLNALQRQELLEASRKFIKAGKPFLGICVGYQALFEKSEEFNSCAQGLGVLKGNVVRFTKSGKIPQIGWNQIQLTRENCPLFKEIAPGTFFYFVHSFFPQPADASVVAATTEYGETFASAVWSGNIFATQFHPEKSQRSGLQLLKNFVSLCE